MPLPSLTSVNDHVTGFFFGLLKKQNILLSNHIFGNKALYIPSPFDI